MKLPTILYSINRKDIKILKTFNFILCFLLSCNFVLSAQGQDIPLSQVKFRKGGDANKISENCYQLNPDINWASGAIWYPEGIDLRKDLTIELEVFLGCNDGGADGIVFIFSPRLAMGRAGEGMGFSGLRPSLGIEFDTYQNFHLGDPSEDHVALLINGSPNHNYNQTRPISIKNLEDCKNHLLKIVWVAQRKELKVSLDGDNIIGFQKNIIADIFNDNPRVFWGISAATGGFRNEHKVCFEKLIFEELAGVEELNSQKKRTLLKGERLVLEDVFFESGKSILKNDSNEELNKLLTFLQANPNMSIGIFGHTDAVGNKSANKTLSQKRAEAVATYLLKNGIPAERLVAKGLGDSKPIASNKTASGRAKNRRVEVYLFRRYP